MKYFAYGSNMSIEQMKARGCVNSKLVGPAKLNAHRFVYQGSSPNWEMKGTANIIEDDNQEVWGVLFEVSEKCLARLDSFEHVPIRRSRKIVNVVDSDSVEHEALVYTLNSDKEINLPSNKYHDRIIGSATTAGLPKEYIKKINKLKKTE